MANGYGQNSTSQAGWPTVLLIEFVASTLFVLVVLGSTAPRANAVLAPVAIGATFAFLLTILAPFDGGSMNPARSTGTAAIGGAQSLSQLWLFWVAPLLGSGGGFDLPCGGFGPRTPPRHYAIHGRRHSKQQHRHFHRPGSVRESSSVS